MEKEARGSGVGEMIGTIKEFGKRFGGETKKTVKQGLNKLVDSIDTGEVKVKHKEPTPPIEPHQIEYPIDGIIIRTLDDINHYFSNPDPDLPKSISPIVDYDGLLFNEHRIRFEKIYPVFKIDRIDFIFTTTEGLIDLMNGKDFKIADYKDLVAYSKFLRAIKRTGPDTKRLQDVDKRITELIAREYELDEADDYTEDYPPIIQEINEFEDMISGQGMTFLSDNNEELLNRLLVILAAMKEGHRSHRQYNEVNCILKRLLEKGIIDENDYKNVIKNVK
ncbi:hypothetical protein LOTGIDRAFT_164609 [Lottia gigantea]|uniref:Uncharacterized protein n=1 Tax=Lottia gigantea TaxID=225164 RepID=V4BM29_LOTGI|nr:hypothetical protein LOTGIDRAFT_164609 [Lottia gigantea]ESO89914.1 hypothetical protein LOTGIDRAFT_164609 [Lottia gigantea]